MADLGARPPATHPQVRPPRDASPLSVAATSAPPADLDLVLNSVVRELGRLQLQVEVLQQQIDDLQSSDRDTARAESRLSVIAEIG